MRLLRDLWATSPRRTAMVALFIVLVAGGQAAARRAGRAGAGGSLARVVRAARARAGRRGGQRPRGRPPDGRAHRRLVGRRAPPAVPGRLRAGPADAGDHPGRRAARPHRRRRLPGGVRDAQQRRADRCSRRRWPGCRSSPRSSSGGRPASACVVLSALVAAALRKPTARIGIARIGEEEAWSDLAAVMEEAIHGQDDVRTSLARPYVLRLYARRAARCSRRGRLVWRSSARVTAVAVRAPPGWRSRSWSSPAAGRCRPAASTAPG